MGDSFNISRTEKNIFSNPFNYQKLGLSMAMTAYHSHITRMRKRYPEEFRNIKGKELICNDLDCWKQVCHKNSINAILHKYF